MTCKSVSKNPKIFWGKLDYCVRLEDCVLIIVYTEMNEMLLKGTQIEREDRAHR